MSIESSLCDYSDVYILAMGNITSGGNNTKAAFKNCAPFRTCITHVLLLMKQNILTLQCQCKV